MTYRATNTNGTLRKRLYRTSASQCKSCPVKQQCITSKNNFKQLAHSPGKPWYDLMAERLNTSYGKRLQHKRKAIVEPALGNRLHQNGMKKVCAKGIQAANKHVMLAGMSMNLKKWLKHGVRSPKGKDQRVDIPGWAINVRV